MGPARTDEYPAIANRPSRECQGRLPSGRRSDHRERIRDRPRRGGRTRALDWLIWTGASLAFGSISELRLARKGLGRRRLERGQARIDLRAVVPARYRPDLADDPPLPPRHVRRATRRSDHPRDALETNERPSRPPGQNTDEQPLAAAGMRLRERRQRVAARGKLNAETTPS